MDMRLNAKASIIQFRIGPRWVSHKKVPLLLFSLQKKLFFSLMARPLPINPLMAWLLAEEPFLAASLEQSCKSESGMNFNKFKFPLKLNFSFLTKVINKSINISIRI